jgi:hypothetical protein
LFINLIAKAGRPSIYSPINIVLFSNKKKSFTNRQKALVNDLENISEWLGKRAELLPVH